MNKNSINSDENRATIIDERHICKGGGHRVGAIEIEQESVVILTLGRLSHFVLGIVVDMRGGAIRVMVIHVIAAGIG